jgi:hypothetical protein
VYFIHFILILFIFILNYFTFHQPKCGGNIHSNRKRNDNKPYFYFLFILFYSGSIPAGDSVVIGGAEFHRTCANVNYNKEPTRVTIDNSERCPG